MAKKKIDNSAYLQLKKDIAEGTLKSGYIFSGEERYLLEYYLNAVKKLAVGEGPEEFNYKTLDGKSMSISQMQEAIDAFPVFADKTLIVVTDFDIFKLAEDKKKEFISVISDIPQYACLVFVYDILSFSPDKRIKLNAEILTKLISVEFHIQEQSDLVNWVARRFKALGKRIDRQTAEYLAFITGGLMTPMAGEIEKVAAFNASEIITKESIDAVVVPVLDAAVYKMTDALVTQNFAEAAKVLGDLLRLQEAPHVILFSISMKLRQLYAAKICSEGKISLPEYMSLAGIRLEFQAKNLMLDSKRVSVDWCKRALKCTYKAAISLNTSTKEGTGILSQLLCELAASGEM